MRRRPLLIALLFSFPLFALTQELNIPLNLLDSLGLEIVQKNQSAEKKEVLKNRLLEVMAELGMDTISKEQVPVVENLITKILTEKKVSSIYGHQLFKGIDDLSLFDQTAIVKIPAAYILGTGDELTISIFGASQLDAKLTINEAGYIAPRKTAMIFLKGLRWDQAQTLLRKKFGQFYHFTDKQFYASLTKLRSITVHIMGEVENPGSYTLSATSTAINALMAAGGPTELGSVRNIKIITDEGPNTLDIYQLIKDPSLQFQHYLEDNYIIQVPVAQKIVTIDGAIQRPMKYELHPQEDLSMLIDYAGGLQANAYTKLSQISRFQEGKKILLDTNLKAIVEKRQNYSLENGDSISIKFITNSIENIASIEGAVTHPGSYSLNSSSHISELLKNGQLKKDAQLDNAFLIRTNRDRSNTLIPLNLQAILDNPLSDLDFNLQALDRLLVPSQSQSSNKGSIQIKGAVRDTLSNLIFNGNNTITIQQALLLAGGLLPEATGIGYIIRPNKQNPNQKKYIRVAIKEALAHAESPANIALQAHDELLILSSTTNTDVPTVSISGAIHRPDTFQYDVSLKLQDVLSLAGGFKSEAAINRLDVYRLQMDNTTPTKTIVATLQVDEAYNLIGGANTTFSLMPNDEIIVRSVPDYERQAFVQIQGAVLFPGPYALLEKKERLSSILQRAGGISLDAFPEGATLHRKGQLVVTQLDQVVKNAQSKYNYILEKGDSLFIPKQENLITIHIGNSSADQLEDRPYQTASQVKVAYEPKKSAKWYINEYVAGFGSKTSKKSVWVTYPNGAIKRVKAILGFIKVYPKLEKGGSIFIGKEDDSLKKEEN